MDTPPITFVFPVTSVLRIPSPQDSGAPSTSVQEGRLLSEDESLPRAVARECCSSSQQTGRSTIQTNETLRPLDIVAIPEDNVMGHGQGSGDHVAANNKEDERGKGLCTPKKLFLHLLLLLNLCSAYFTYKYGFVAKPTLSMDIFSRTPAPTDTPSSPPSTCEELPTVCLYFCDDPKAHSLFVDCSTYCSQGSLEAD